MFQDLVLKLVDPMLLMAGSNKNRILFAGIATVVVLICGFVLYRKWSKSEPAKPTPKTEPMNVEDTPKRSVQFVEESYSEREAEAPASVHEQAEEEQNTQQE